MVEKLSKEIWKSVTDLTQSKLKENGLSCDFNPPAIDGRYVKMKGKFGLYFAFAVNQIEVWVELEIKPKNGQPQESVYNQIHAKSSEIEKRLGYKIRWDNEDRKTLGKREARGVYRIKSIMQFSPDDIRSIKSNTVESFAERMVLFIQALSPFLSGIEHSMERKTVDATLRETYLPEKSDIDLAELQLRRTFTEVVIGEEAVLDQVVKDFEKAGKPLKENWRETTKQNISKWFSNNSEG
ncbi:MAG: DUF4268 domain-containing protein [Deltaproteobacteria bacterium]|nr:DUF4268 domain-containing protein [Deltaproteobacteria bacterium]